ncbi:hypothetical protein [endosymbiont of Tevnia jerichonana]|uniref:hypothetical protein n=1 Tax=endosymbiont of Tevnia jerichonana TaxID=94785 RepID=UPI0002EF9C8C|nr:hypothetical protein [endosymbiont of Tevnia jerichonana]
MKVDSQAAAGNRAASTPDKKHTRFGVGYEYRMKMQRPGRSHRPARPHRPVRPNRPGR